MLVAELRKREYEAFPKVKDAKKAGEDDDVVENEDEVALDEDAGARDFDYLLGVSILTALLSFNTNSFLAPNLVPNPGASR